MVHYICSEDRAVSLSEVHMLMAAIPSPSSLTSYYMRNNTNHYLDTTLTQHTISSSILVPTDLWLSKWSKYLLRTFSVVSM